MRIHYYHGPAWMPPGFIPASFAMHPMYPTVFAGPNRSNRIWWFIGGGLAGLAGIAALTHGEQLLRGLRGNREQQGGNE